MVLSYLCICRKYLDLFFHLYHPFPPPKKKNHLKIFMGHKSSLVIIKIEIYLGVMAMKQYFTLFRSPELEPHYLMQFNVIPRPPPFLGINIFRQMGEIQTGINQFEFQISKLVPFISFPSFYLG